MVVHDKFVFVHLPKTGGNFIEYFLVNNIEGCCAEGRSHLELREFYNNASHRKKVGLFVETLKNLFGIIFDFRLGIYRLKTNRRFAFGYIRNPFDWYVSWWKDNLRSTQYIDIEDLYKNGRDKDFNKFIHYTFNRRHTLARNLFFNTKEMYDLNIGSLTHKFLRIYSKYNFKKYLEDPDLIYKKDILEYMNKFLRFEFLKSDLCQTFRKHLTPLDAHQTEELYRMEKMNTSEHAPYQWYYDQKTIDLIYEKDKLIFDMFGYKFGD